MGMGNPVMFEAGRQVKYLDEALGVDCFVDDIIQPKKDLEFIGFTDFKYLIRRGPNPADDSKKMHIDWVWFQGLKV
tara:strand:- start:2035 stop:2262 length:228 start_codon:yes stop_codon:yes gene_type:complete